MRRLLMLTMIAMIMFGAVLPTAAQDNILIMARAADATGLDPHTQTAFASLRLMELVYEPLLRVDDELEIIPALAESWEFSDDGLTLTFTLRQAVKFHDGSDMTSEDVVASLNRILDENVGAATRTNLLSITTIEAPDDYTVVLTLSLPDVPLLAALASANVAIMPAELIAEGDPTTTVIGTGAYQLDNWTPNETTTLSAFADYWGEGPFVDGIEIRIIPDEQAIMDGLKTGEIHFALFNDPLIATQPLGEADVTVNRAPSLDYHVLQLRASEPPLDILEVRQAIACAINREEILETASEGRGTVTGPLTIPRFQMDQSELFCYEQDLDRARELMAEAGFGEEGFPLTVMVAKAEPPTALAEAQTIQRQLGQIGIRVAIEVLELDVYVDRWLAGDFTAAVALNGGRPDPYTMYARYWINDAQFANTAGYIDETLDSLMKQGQVETNPAARFDIFAEFQRHITEVAPWVWLYNGFNYTGQQNSVTGFVPNPTSTIYTLNQVQINQ